MPNDFLDPDYTPPFPFKGGISLADLGKRFEQRSRPQRLPPKISPRSRRCSQN
jgi:hypothetical protein